MAKRRRYLTATLPDGYVKTIGPTAAPFTHYWRIVATLANGRTEVFWGHAAPKLDYAGTFGLNTSSDRFRVNAIYGIDGVSLSWTTTFVSGGDYVLDFVSADPAVEALNRVKDYWLHNAQLRFDVKPDISSTWVSTMSSTVSRSTCRARRSAPRPGWRRLRTSM